MSLKNEIIETTVDFKWYAVTGVLLTMTTNIFAFIKTNLLTDVGFLVMLAIVVFLDTIFGISKNYKQFELGIFAKKLIKKLALYGAAILIGLGFEYIGNGLIRDGYEIVGGGVKFVAKSLYILIYTVEADSVSKNGTGFSIFHWITKAFENLSKLKKPNQ